jgi:septal ring factor EnvC (AmiA/AmiB activator)
VFAQSKLKLVSTFIALLSCLFLAGCQNMGGGDVDPRLTEGESAKFFSKSGAQACAAGALTGVLACALTNSSNKAACMAIAAVAGCGVGAGANYLLDQRRAKFANNEQRINSFIEDVQSDNQKLRSRMQNISVVLQENQKTLASLNAQVAAKKVDQKKAKAELDRINANKAYLEKELANINTRIDDYQDIIEKERAVGANVRQLQGQLDQLSRTRDAMKGQLDVAYGLASSIKVTG